MTDPVRKDATDPGFRQRMQVNSPAFFVSAALASALPFAVVMLFICYGPLRALQTESKGSPIDLSIAADPPIATGMNWPQRLASITHFHNKRKITAFLIRIVQSVLNAVAVQIRESDRAPKSTQEEDWIHLIVPHGDFEPFRYTIPARSFRAPSSSWNETKRPSPERWRCRAMAYSSEGGQAHAITSCTRDQLINKLLNRYARFRHARRLS